MRKPPRDFPDPRELMGMGSRFVPADANIAELEKKASDCEQRLAKAEESQAQELRREVKLYREWIAALRSGRWTS